MEHSSYVVTDGPDSEAVRRLHAVMDAATVNACVSSVLYKVMAPYRETRIIPDFVDDSRFIIQETAPRETFTFRAMGQLRPIKGHDTLIPVSYTHLAPRLPPPWRLLFQIQNP